MRSGRWRAGGLCLLLVGLLCGCGGKTEPGAPGDAGGQAGNGGDPSCGDLNDELGWSIEVQIRNETADTLYLGLQNSTCGQFQLFTVSDAAGVQLPMLPDCRTPCEQVVKGGPIGCPTVCLIPSTLTVEPGEGSVVTYSGLYAQMRQLPERCLPAGVDGPLQCERARQISPGQFTFEAVAGSELDCSNAFPDCSCEPTGNGGCTTSGALIGGTLVSARATVNLDASYGVGNAASSDGAGSGGIGATRPVELVFGR